MEEERKLKTCPVLSKLIVITSRPVGKIMPGAMVPVKIDTELVKTACLGDDCMSYDKNTGDCRLNKPTNPDN